MSPQPDPSRTALNGLATQEAAARLDQFGPNEPAASQHHSFLSDPFLPHHRGPVSYRVVYRIAREPNATAARYLHVSESIPQPAQPSPSRDLPRVVAIGIYLPFSPLAGVLGFTAMPALYYVWDRAGSAITGRVPWRGRRCSGSREVKWP